uniref:Alpha-2-macroglobulin n=1 Tax=Leptobrachium leishanense TaxID=445787 RepID=A0A8C5WG59_9ANUR
MLKVLLLCLLLLDLICGQSIGLGYLVILPSTLYYSTNENAYVHVLTPDNDGELVVKMVTKAANITLATQKYTTMESQQCVTFSVPESTEEQEVATIEVWATGNGVHEMMESKNVVIKKTEVQIVMQTEKPILQPGQTARCRVARLNRNLIALDEVDPEGNKIAQWRNVHPRNGMAELSYTLPDVLSLGEYKFTMKGDHQEVSVPFAVAKYVLPKFQLKMSAPGSIPITQKPFDINVCGTYTYGKPVIGEVTGKICHRASPGSGKTDICKPITGKTDTRGCYTARIDTGSLELKSSGYEYYLDVEASLTEGGTGVKMQEKKSIRITYTLNIVDFLDKNPSYRKGIAFKGKMQLSTNDGSPMPNEELSLFVSGVLQNDVYRTDERGVATFSLDTTSWTNINVDLRGEYNPPEPVADTGEVQPHYQHGYTTVKLFYSELRSQLQIRRDPSSVLCGDKAQLWADFILDPLEFDGQTSVVFYTLVVSQGRVKRDSKINHELTQKSDLKGFISVPITFNDDLAPVATLIIYFVPPGGGLVADGAEFEISDNCYPNKVSVKLSEKQTLPASELHLNIRAAPGSLCSCRSIDKSIILLQEDTHNAESQVNSFLLLLAQREYPQEVQEFQRCFSPQPFPVPMEDRLVRAKRPLMPFYFYEIDIFSIFQGCGMKIMSSERYRKPEECHDLQPFMLARDEFFAFSAVERPMAEFAEISKDSTAESKPAEAAPQIRKDFAETWLFNLYEVGPSGQTTIAVTAPDTITQYVVDTLCMSPVGIGFSPQETLDIFKPFFVEVVTPYSIKRGESFALKAIIFNHLKQCIKVRTNDASI